MVLDIVGFAHPHRTDPTRPDPTRLRLRVAVHRGEVLIDPRGFVGGALVEASRLSNTAVLRAQLDATSADMAVIVSDLVWRELLESRTWPGHRRGGDRWAW
jgi:class 3 adenylate cyclase